MRKVLNKLRTNPEVCAVIDAAVDLEHAEDRSLEAALSLYGSAFRAYSKEIPPGIKDDVSRIFETGRKYTIAFNESFSQRSIKEELKRLQTNQSNYTKARDRNKHLEQKSRDSAAVLEKKRAAHEKAQNLADHVEAGKAQLALNIATAQAEADQKAYTAHNEQFEAEGITYRKNVVLLLATPLERLLESRRATLQSVLDCGAEISRIAEGMTIADEDVSQLEAQLANINTELQEFGE
jgi:hypothetical protein